MAEFNWDNVGLDPTTWPILGHVYNKFYADPAEQQKKALDEARVRSEFEADRNRRFQLEGLDRAQSYYAPARNVLSEMMGGISPSGFGDLSPARNSPVASEKPTDASTQGGDQTSASGQAFGVGGVSGSPGNINPSTGLPYTPYKDTDTPSHTFANDAGDFVPIYGSVNRATNFVNNPSPGTGTAAALSIAAPGANALVDVGTAAANKLKWW